MNWLAHLWLSRHDDLEMAGNLAGDFWKGRLEDARAELRPGIRLHRAIDAFTDAHPLVRAARGRLAGHLELGRGVVVDVVYDHFLARDFARWSAEPLAAFAARAHAALARHEALLPDALRRVLPYMRDQRWLVSYAEPEGAELALRRIAGRLKRRLPLAEAARVLIGEPDVEAGFVVFFTELQTETAGRRAAERSAEDGE